MFFRYAHEILALVITLALQVRSVLGPWATLPDTDQKTVIIVVLLPAHSLEKNSATYSFTDICRLAI